MEDNDAFKLSQSETKLWKENLPVDAEMGKSLWDKVTNKVFSAMKVKHLAEWENVHRAEQLLLIRRRKNIYILLQCYIWFQGCKLDCTHVTIAYAIR